MMLETMAPRKRGRPKGLWKGRVTVAPRFVTAGPGVHDRQPDSSDTDNDEIGNVEEPHPSPKHRRYLTLKTEDVYLWDYSRRRSPGSEQVCRSNRRTKVMDTTTTARRGALTDAKTSCDYEDWEDLKDLFARAAERYESDDSSEALPLLRGVIHECHRFLIFYEDPSVLFVNATQPPSSPDLLTPSHERLARDWDFEQSAAKKADTQPPGGRTRKYVELPTAFHTILGTALFFFGNIIAQDSNLALVDEPNNPCPYWLAAVDVFETGENLPSRICGRGYSAPEDWRMAVVWGRTLVSIADEIVTRTLEVKNSTDDAINSTSRLAQFSSNEPNWPKESPFSVIAARRPPVTQRMSLSSESPNELMIFAMDQFSRGIFHMPHPQHTSHHPSVSTAQPFSRAKELFTIASEVLILAEKLEIASERQYWASWADSVFNQMKMEADMDAWRGPIMRSRGRCCLVVGTARAEDLDEALEKGEMEVLHSEEAQDAREALTMAITFLERAKSCASPSFDPEIHELQPLLAEALLTLANLTFDENKREELYARAQLENGNQFDLDEREQQMDESS